jgi:hypothetical protein
MNNIKVGCFVVGAPKCGTTSIYSALDGLVGIDLPKRKETHYFCWEEAVASYYDVDVVKTYQEYCSQFSGDGLAVDICPSYLSSNTAPCRIRDHNPNAKIVVVVRDPIERAISHYLMDRRLGLNNLSFNNSLCVPSFYKEYVAEGFYKKYIDEYVKLFGIERVAVFNLGEIVNDEKVREQLFKFITNDNYSLLPIPVENSFAHPRFMVLARLRRFLQKARIGRCAPAFIKRFMLEYVFEKKGNKPDFSEERLVLQEIYKSNKVVH